MNAKPDTSELLKRKFEPISDWRPAGQTTGSGEAAKLLFQEALEDAKKKGDSLAKSLEPLTEDAKVKIKEFAGFMEEFAGKSPNEVRSFLANALESLAAKIKPRS